MTGDSWSVMLGESFQGFDDSPVKNYSRPFYKRRRSVKRRHFAIAGLFPAQRVSSAIAVVDGDNSSPENVGRLAAVLRTQFPASAVHPSKAGHASSPRGVPMMVWDRVGPFFGSRI